MSTDVAISPLAGFGVTEEAVFGTPLTVDTWPAVTSCNMKREQPQKAMETIFGSSEVQDSVAGLIVAGGAVSMPAAPSVGFAYMLKWATKTYTVGALPYSITGVPTSAASTNGNRHATRLATAAALPAGTYVNGAAGVGATFTVTATGVLTVDAVATALNDYILVKNQVDQTQNGLYKVTTAGAGGVAAILTRAVEMDATGEYVGAVIIPSAGTANTGKIFEFTGSVAPTVGTTPITFTLVAGYTGTIIFSVAAVARETATGRLFCTNPSPGATGLALVSQAADLAWVLPNTNQLPSGFTAAGVLLLESTVGGNLGTSLPFHYISDPAATTFTTDGSLATSGSLPAAQNLFKFDQSDDQPKSFTAEKVLNNGSSELYQGNMINSYGTTLKPGDVVQFNFDIFSQDMQKLTPSSVPATPVNSPFKGQKFYAQIGFQGGALTFNPIVNEFTFNVSNGARRYYDATGEEFLRIIRTLLREITANISLEFEDMTQFDNFKAEKEMAFLITVNQPSGMEFNEGANTVYSWPNQLIFDIPNAVYNSSEGEINSKNPIVQKLPLLPRADPSTGYAMQIRLVTSAVADLG